MNSLHLTKTSENAGTYKVVAAVKETIDRVKLEAEKAKKQRLYAQMLKDGITSRHLLDQVSEEINAINAKLYGHGAKYH